MPILRLAQDASAIVRTGVFQGSVTSSKGSVTLTNPYYPYTKVVYLGYTTRV